MTGDGDPLREWLLRQTESRDELVVKSKRAARYVDLSPSQIGHRLRMLKETDEELDIDRHERSSCYEWRIRRADHAEGTEKTMAE